MDGLVLAVVGRGERTHGIAIQRLEQVDRLLEIDNDFLLRRIRGITFRLHGTNASAMLVPLMLPKALIITPVVFPIGFHVIQQCCLAGSLQDLRDVGVFARSVTVGVVGPVAVVGPQSVDGPAILGPDGGICVPELGQEH